MFALHSSSCESLGTTKIIDRGVLYILSMITPALLGFSSWMGINSFVQFVSPQIIMVMFRYFFFIAVALFLLFFSIIFLFEGVGAHCAPFWLLQNISLLS